MKKGILFLTLLLGTSYNCFAADRFWSGVFWGAAATSALSSHPSADDVARAQNKLKHENEIEGKIFKEKLEREKYCKLGGFQTELTAAIKEGSIPLRQVKHKGSLNVRYIFTNPNDANDPYEVKVENPKLEAERLLYKKFYTIKKHDHTVKVGNKSIRFLPESYDYYSEGILDKDKDAAESLKKNINSTDPKLRIITISTSKGSLTYTVLDGEIAGILNNTLGTEIPVKPKTEKDVTALKKAKEVFDNLKDHVAYLEGAIGYCTNGPGSLEIDDNESGKTDKQISDDNIRLRRKFFAGFKEATAKAQSVPELAADEQGIVANPCYGQHGTPFSSYYGFKIVDGYVVKYKSPDSEGKVHKDGKGDPVSYNSVSQFLQDSSINCRSDEKAAQPSSGKR
ncbi:MAG: hypothetical protein ACXVCY_07180 [Pseudobdellovibrionaceae bacterium]